jgi:ABC-type transporter Mla MlaB component
MSFAAQFSLYHVDCDLRHVRRADLATVTALARAHLNARRQGVPLRLVNVPPQLQELIAFAGLEEVLLGRRQGKSEEGEEPLRVEERGEAHDPPV